MKKLLLLITLLTGNFIFAQVGIGTDVPSPSAQLEIKSSNRGVLIPQIALTSVTDQVTITAGNVESLLVYNTSNSNSLTPGYYYWSEGAWKKLAADADVTLPANVVYWDVVNNQFIRIDENGDVQIIGDADLQTLTFLKLNADGYTLEYTDEDASVTKIDLKKIIETFQTVTKLTDNNDGTITFTNEKGASVTINVTKGVKGDKGDPGVQGPAGPAGTMGPQGPVGPQGIPGERGFTGPEGPAGPQGIKGDAGDTGEAGQMGPEGPAGVQGPRGIQGIPGVEGPVGPVGPRGIPGPEGPEGQVGPRGIQGPEGPVGPMGIDGPRGIQGLAGVKGDKGDKGDQGEKGERGEKGEPGYATSTYFYLPPVPVYTNQNQVPADQTLGTVNVYDMYKKQSTPLTKNPGASTTLPIEPSSQLDYFVTWYDTTKFSNVAISNSGVLTYSVIGGSGNLPSYMTIIVAKK